MCRRLEPSRISFPRWRGLALPRDSESLRVLHPDQAVPELVVDGIFRYVPVVGPRFFIAACGEFGGLRRPQINVCGRLLETAAAREHRDLLQLRVAEVPQPAVKRLEIVGGPRVGLRVGTRRAEV